MGFYKTPVKRHGYPLWKIVRDTWHTFIFHFMISLSSSLRFFFALFIIIVFFSHIFFIFICNAATKKKSHTHTHFSFQMDLRGVFHKNPLQKIKDNWNISQIRRSHFRKPREPNDPVDRFII